MPIFNEIKENGRKVLIAEDTVNTGNSLQGIREALESRGIRYDIVALTQFEDSEVEGVIAANRDMTSLYGNKVMSGIHKDSDEIFSRPLRKPLDKKPNNIPKVSDYGPEVIEAEEDIYPSKAEILKRTRELASSISEELVEEYLAGREKSESK